MFVTGESTNGVGTYDMLLIKYKDYGASKNMLTVIKSGTGTGTVTSSPAGIACGATCSAGYDFSTSVTLTAVAHAHSAFAGWSGGWPRRHRHLHGNHDC